MDPCEMTPRQYAKYTTTLPMELREAISTESRRVNAVTKLLDRAIGPLDWNGYPRSRYATLDANDNTFEIRVSDHEQVTGGGFSQSSGDRYGDSDVSIALVGYDVEIDKDGKDKIVNQRIKLQHLSSEIPRQIQSKIKKVVQDFRKVLIRREADSAKSVLARKRNKEAAQKKKNAVRTKIFNKLKAKAERTINKLPIVPTDQLISIAKTIKDMPFNWRNYSMKTLRREIRDRRINQEVSRLYRLRTESIHHTDIQCMSVHEARCELLKLRSSQAESIHVNRVDNNRSVLCNNYFYVPCMLDQTIQERVIEPFKYTKIARTGKEAELFKNPTFADVRQLVNKSTFSVLRLIVTDSGKGDVYAWDAVDALHVEMAKYAGIRQSQMVKLELSGNAGSWVYDESSKDTWAGLNKKATLQALKDNKWMKRMDVEQAKGIVAEAEGDNNTTDKTEPEKDAEKEEKIGYSLKDVQAFYDAKLVLGNSPEDALKKTKKQFKVNDLRVSPAGRVLAPKLPKGKAVQPPLPPDPNAAQDPPPDGSSSTDQNTPQDPLQKDTAQ